MADYFSLGNRSNAYLTIAPIIAQLSPRFHAFIVQHLYQHKLAHWDSEVRNLAAKALGKLTTINPQPHKHVQRAAGANVVILFRSDCRLALIMLKYMTGVQTDMNIAVVRGYTLALGTLPAKLLTKPAGRLQEVLACMEVAMSREHRIAEELDADLCW